ncbi:hypothetical protein ACQKMV_09370 [Lysinibacillus sp. NPDC094403]|uniref:hypothetical protein n=1 Tax=Lysinibacillus sp. NPDC094403 TaxID=3390581 RepID=UPI003D038321
MSNSSEEFIPSLYDKMIDNTSYTNSNNKVTRIIVDTHNQNRKKSIHSECILKDSFLGSCNGIINAHSIQNSGILDKLSENNYVLPLDNFTELFNIDIEKLLLGKNEATIFRGFCKKHDEVFRPIEDIEYGYNKELQNYLFAYRAFCKRYIDSKSSYNYYSKRFSDFVDSEKLEGVIEKHADIPIQRKEIREHKKTYTNKRQVKRMEEFNKLLKKNEQLKFIFNTNLEKQRYFKIQTLELEFSAKNILACSSMIDIATDFQGKLFNKNLKYPLFLSVLPVGDTTKVLISYLKTHSTYLERIINVIKNSNVHQQEIILSNILIKNANNIIFNPLEFRKFNEKSIKIIAGGQLRRTQSTNEPLVTLKLNIFRPQ